MTKPLECPFCHGTNAYYEVDEWDKGYITCPDCHAQGPTVDAKRGANSKARSLWMKAVRR